MTDRSPYRTPVQPVVPPQWQTQALCAQVDPDLWFPEKGGSTRPAKDVCAECQVRQECLEYALDNDMGHGVWGGMSERERHRLGSRPRRAPLVAVKRELSDAELRARHASLVKARAAQEAKRAAS